MSISNNFSEYCETISNTELLIILNNPADYQPLAVEAAKIEFLKRQLSDTEIKTSKESLIAQQLQKEKQLEKANAIKDKIKTTGQTLINTLNPIQSELPSTEKTIQFIVIVFGGIFLLQIIKDFKMHLAYLKNIPRFPLECALYFLPVLLLPAATFTFWKRKKIGWMLLTIFLIFSIVTGLWLLIQSILHRPSANSTFDNLFSPLPILPIIIEILFLVATLYIICKQSIRDVFSITENKMIATISITGILTFFIVYAN